MSAPALQRVCAWCKKPLGQRACEPGMDGKVTDGICPDCACREYVQIAAMGPAPGDPAGFWPVVLIAGICGLTAAELARFKPKGWRAGLHVMDLPGRGEMWRECFLGEVVGEMAVEGAPRAGARLMTWLGRDLPAFQLTAGSGARTGENWTREARPTSTAPAREPQSWATRWEAEHE